MTQEHEAGLIVGAYHFRACACLPRASVIDSSVPASFDRFSARFQDAAGAGTAGLLIAFESGLSLRVLLYSCEGRAVGPDMARLHEAMLEHLFPPSASEPSKPEYVMDDLQRYALRTEMLVSAALLVVDSSDEDMQGTESFATATIFMAGLPPAVLVENGQYHFPVRSGIPLGVPNVQVRSQTIEIPPHSSLVLHSPPGGVGHRLLRFHRGLADFKVAGVPPDVILFRLSLE